MCTTEYGLPKTKQNNKVLTVNFTSMKTRMRVVVVLVILNIFLAVTSRSGSNDSLMNVSTYFIHIWTHKVLCKEYHTKLWSDMSAYCWLNTIKLTIIIRKFERVLNKAKKKGRSYICTLPLDYLEELGVGLAVSA